MTRFRKKPVVIEAEHLDRMLELDDFEEIAVWCGGKIAWGPTAEVAGILIDTLEGQMRADIDDWIIKGVKGEFYPCKPDIFAETYEPTTASEVPQLHGFGWTPPAEGGDEVRSDG